MKCIKNIMCSKKQAFTLVEILIALIILTILTLILVPRLTERAERARVTTALSDIRALERAQSQVEIDTGYFVRLFILNDSRRNDEEPDQINDISQYPDDMEYAIDPESGFLVLVDFRNETFYDWYGPYITYDRIWADHFNNAQESPYMQIPLDPWGMPYILFTHRGRVVEEGEDQAGGPRPGEQVDNVFNQMTILSTGPDRTPGERGVDEMFAAPGSDDIFRSF